MAKIKQLLRDNALSIIGAIIGGVGGYVYWFKIGCTSGTCPITSSPVMSVIWGGLMGSLLVGMFKKKEEQKN
ncbi:MAG: DUF6132 family protein [Tannerella sp.]|jgi:hypothetical protein|nr:DUF6132 family protein [Tannerella sp.]